jgi:hypothetical protein
MKLNVALEDMMSDLDTVQERRGALWESAVEARCMVDPEYEDWHRVTVLVTYL